MKHVNLTALAILWLANIAVAAALIDIALSDTVETARPGVNVLAVSTVVGFVAILNLKKRT